MKKVENSVERENVGRPREYLSLEPPTETVDCDSDAIEKSGKQMNYRTETISNHE